MRKTKKNDKLLQEWQEKVDSAFIVLEVDARSMLWRLKDINKCNAKPTTFIKLDKYLNEIIVESTTLLERLNEVKNT